LVVDNSNQLSAVTFGTGFGGITDIKTGPTDGFLYVLSINDGNLQDCTVLRLKREDNSLKFGPCFFENTAKSRLAYTQSSASFFKAAIAATNSLVIHLTVLFRRVSVLIPYLYKSVHQPRPWTIDPRGLLFVVGWQWGRQRIRRRNVWMLF